MRRRCDLHLSTLQVRPFELVAPYRDVRCDKEADKEAAKAAER
jgi:hypothetical protein